MGNIWYSQPRIMFFRVRDYENIWSEHRHSDKPIELLYVLEGKFTLEFANGACFPAVAGDFLMVREGEVHRDVFDTSRGLRILIIQFQWDGAEKFFELVGNRTLRDLDFSTRTEATRRINFMYDKWDSGEFDLFSMNVQLHGLLTLFYLAAERARLRPSETPGTPELKLARPDMMRQVKFYLTQNYSSSVTLEQLAARFEISAANLSRLFRHEFGIGFSRYLTALRLESAVALLNSTNLPVSEVALRCGFSTSGYFIRIFRKHFGATPKDYRRRERREEDQPEYNRSETARI